MATSNPFDLLGDDDNGDASQLEFVPLEKPTTKKAPQPAQAVSAKLPSKPLPPAQAVRESRNGVAEEVEGVEEETVIKMQAIAIVAVATTVVTVLIEMVIIMIMTAMDIWVVVRVEVSTKVGRMDLLAKKMENLVVPLKEDEDMEGAVVVVVVEDMEMMPVMKHRGLGGSMNVGVVLDEAMRLREKEPVEEIGALLLIRDSQRNLKN